MSEDLRTVTVVIVVIAGIAGLIIYLIDANHTCPRFAQQVKLSYRYDFWAGGCFVKVRNGQWVRSKNYWNAVPQR